MADPHNLGSASTTHLPAPRSFSQLAPVPGQKRLRHPINEGSLKNLCSPVGLCREGPQPHNAEAPLESTFPFWKFCAILSTHPKFCHPAHEQGTPTRSSKGLEVGELSFNKLKMHFCTLKVPFQTTTACGVPQQGVEPKELPQQIPEQEREPAVGIPAAVFCLCLLHDKWICHFNILLEQASKQLIYNA